MEDIIHIKTNTLIQLCNTVATYIGNSRGFYHVELWPISIITSKNNTATKRPGTREAKLGVDYSSQTMFDEYSYASSNYGPLLLNILPEPPVQCAKVNITCHTICQFLHRNGFSIDPGPLKF
jgi:hypothetical protein